MRQSDAFIAAAVLFLVPFCASAADVVSWDVLSKVEVTRQKDRYVPAFSKQIAALDKTQVRLQGFMLPLDQGAKQKRFLLSAQPPECQFCMPGSAEQFVEVQAKDGFKYVLDAITVTGKFELVRDDSGGLLYRLLDAVPAQK